MKAKVVVELRSQYEDEMDLFKDELVVITETIDKMYFRGHSMDGLRSGTIPKRFVEIIDDEPPDDQHLPQYQQSLVANGQMYMNTEDLMANTGPNGTDGLDNPPSYENAIHSMYMSDILGQPFAAQAAATCQPSSLGYSNTFVGDVQSYGRTLFPFTAEYVNELSLRENEIVHLIRHIDNDWIEGEIDGKVGIFPKSYVEIIVDCDINNSLTASDNNHLNNSYIEEFPADSFGRVLYDFNGEIEADLKVRKGDTITLIRKADDNWWEAMDDLGNVGLIPSNYCELIDDILSINSINSSRNVFSFDETTQDFQPNNENNINLSDSNNTENQTPVTTTNLYDIKPVIIHEEVQEVNTNEYDNNLNNNQLLSDHKDLEPKLSPLLPRRSAPSVPRISEITKTSEAAINITKMAPHRPPPPVPKHKSKLRTSCDSIDSIHLNRQESVRSSIASNSSSGSTKSDMASGVTVIHMSAEDQQRVNDRAKKVREQRGCVIMELLQTERDYKMNLEVCADIFIKNPDDAKNNGIDLNRLFGNLEDVIQVSSLLIQKLEVSTQMKKYEHQMIGKCFLEVLDQMKNTYHTYCKNHDDLQPLWNRYQGQPDVKLYLQRGLDIMREKTNCFDIPSVLIKPVQRILKYPLLLNELHKCTEDGHQDKPDLILAIDRITDMATHINEFKRRQDLVHKYRNESTHKLTSRLSKLNLHTVMKKGSRLGHRISSTLGLSTTTKDEEFNKEVQKFRTLEKTIKIFVKDKEAFMKSVEDFSNQGFTLVETIAEYYDKRNRQQEVEQLRTTHRVIVTQYLNEFKLTVERNVTPVLDKLLFKFGGPNKLICKRFDKLADYDSLSKKLESNKDTIKQRGLQEQQQLAKHVYEALNTQLLEELPQLCELSLEVLKDCIQAFLFSRKRLIGRIAQNHLPLLDLPLVMGFSNGSSADITETFQIKYNLIIEQLLDEISLLPANVFPNNSGGLHSSQTDLRRNSGRNSKRNSQLPNVNLSVAKVVGVNSNTNKNVRQSTSQRGYLQARYQSHQLFIATKAYEACDVLDIYLNKEDLVGVMKRQDPMGNSHRWYVDTGNAQGFVLASILVPFHDDSWVTPPNTHETSTRPQTIYEMSEKKALSLSENRMSTSSSTTNSSSLLQHQFKVHPTPEPPIHLRQDIETHRYEVVDDSPPRYSRLDLQNDSLLSFDESIDEKQQSKPQLNKNLSEFDPYAPVDQVEQSSSTAQTYHRYDEVPVAPTEPMNAPIRPHRQSSSQPNPDHNLYFAAYPFRTNDSNQLSIEFGQPVVVLKDRDLNGNTQWWFVQDRDGRTGYVPANYLQKYQTKD